MLDEDGAERKGPTIVGSVAPEMRNLVKMTAGVGAFTAAVAHGLSHVQVMIIPTIITLTITPTMTMTITTTVTTTVTTTFYDDSAPAQSYLLLPPCSPFTSHPVASSPPTL